MNLLLQPIIFLYMQKYIYGIDFGTSNSALAILNTETQTIEKLFTIPSLLFFPTRTHAHEPLEIFIGQEAKEKYINSQMNGRFMKSIKKALPNKAFVDTKIGGKSYRIEDLVAIIISNLKKQADKYLGLDIKTAVLGRPVVFDIDPEKDAYAQKRLIAAAEIAGLTDIHIQLEPIGAAFTYERQIQKEEQVLVADFGGGTSDFSLLKLNPAHINLSNRSQDMLAQGGVYIGGDSFDSDIMWHRGTPHFGRGIQEQTQPDKWLDLPLSYFKNICSWEKMNFLDTLRWRESIKKSYFQSGNNPLLKNLQTLLDQNLGYEVFKKIEEAKIELTHQPNGKFIYTDFGIDENISLQDFGEEIIAKNLNEIKSYLENFLREKNINTNNIDTVFMTGGSSYVKPLQQIFIELFGAEKIKSGDNFNSVALGLAYSYNIFKEAKA